MENKRREAILSFLYRQIDSLYGLNDSDSQLLSKHLEQALDRTFFCFSKNKNKYFRDNDIDLFHTGQMMIFLYYLANTIYREEKGQQLNTIVNMKEICGKVYCLNKLISQCDIYYEFSMPDYFMVYHPLGSVIGRATINNGFMFMQGCTVGENNGIHPILGENVLLFSNAKILGRCKVGNNVLISANSYVKDMDIPDYSIVFGQYPNVSIVSKREKVEGKIAEFFS